MFNYTQGVITMVPRSEVWVTMVITPCHRVQHLLVAA